MYTHRMIHYRRNCLATLLLSLLILLYCVDTWIQDAYAAPIANQVLRLHILADSDEPEEQRVKLLVRDGVVSLFAANLSPQAERDKVEQWALAHEDEILRTAEKILREQGHADPVTMSVTDSYFPTRTYGSLTFPCGTYRALRLRIGSGTGHNWWCVLSPSLCLDACSQSQYDIGARSLEDSLPAKEYEKLIAEESDVSYQFWLSNFWEMIWKIK